MFTSLLVFSLTAFANNSWRDERFPVPGFPSGYYWTPRSGPKVIHLPQQAREKSKAIVIFQNQVQLWENGRYSSYYNFTSDKSVPFGEYKLSGYQLVQEGQSKRGELKIQTSKGQQCLRIYWRPDRLGEWVKDGIPIFHYDCLL